MLPGGQIAYVLWRSTGPNHSLGSKPQQFEWFQTGEEAIIANIHPEPTQLQDHPKDQGEKLVEFGLAEEEERLSLSV